MTDKQFEDDKRIETPAQQIERLEGVVGRHYPTYSGKLVLSENKCVGRQGAEEQVKLAERMLTERILGYDGTGNILSKIFFRVVDGIKQYIKNIKYSPEEITPHETNFSK